MRLAIAALLLAACDARGSTTDELATTVAGAQAQALIPALVDVRALEKMQAFGTRYGGGTYSCAWSHRPDGGDEWDQWVGTCWRKSGSGPSTYAIRMDNYVCPYGDLNGKVVAYFGPSITTALCRGPAVCQDGNGFVCGS